MLPKRDTRVQLFIIENGRYVMLQHHIKQKGLFVWGLPGGGMEPGETCEETALREAFEETGLRIRLMPGRFERSFASSPLYRRAVTFIAAPESGTARLGEEPEEELKDLYALTGIRWQDLGDRDLPKLAIENTQPILDFIASPSVEKIRNHVFADTTGRVVFAKGDGGILFDGDEEEFEELEAVSHAATKLDGNIVEHGGSCRFETTLVHEVRRNSLKKLGDGRWMKASDATGMMKNLGVGRYLKGKIGKEDL